MTSINDYTIIKPLGSGQFGETFKVTNNTDGKTYAMKKIFPSYGADKYQKLIEKESIANEIETLQVILAICQNVAPCFKETFTFQGSLYIVMDFINGWNLHGVMFGSNEKLEPVGRIPLSERVYKYKSIVIDLVSGLQRLHALGVIHQDIKDENIMYDADAGRFKFIDFGLACLLKTGVDTGEKRAYSSLFNPPCGGAGNMLTMPPELIDMQTSNSIQGNIYPAEWLRAHDIWSLGWILFLWFTFPDTEKYDEEDTYLGYYFTKRPGMYKRIFSGLQQSHPDIYGLVIALFQRDPQVRVDIFDEITVTTSSIGVPPHVVANWDDGSITVAAQTNLDVWKKQIQKETNDAEIKREEYIYAQIK